jgi:hypothetical protein
MNHFFISLLCSSLFIFGLFAQDQNSSTPTKICGNPHLDQFDMRSYLDNLKKTDPIAYREFLQKDKALITYNRNIKDQQLFWAYNFNSNAFYQIQATLRKTGGRVRIWVEDDSWNSAYVTQAEVDSIYKALEISTRSGSLYPYLGIVDIDTMLFGQPPNRNGDGMIDFLLLDIQDDFDPDAGNFSFIAGYFLENDQGNNTGSNQRDLLYLDSQPGIFYKDERRTYTVLATTAHELQHLIHYNYDTGEYLWVNEGLSELASIYCGYGIGFPYLYLRDTNKNLTLWFNNVADYAKVGLWTLYVAEQLGLDFIKTLTQHPQNSVLSYNAILPAFTNLSFNQIYENWAIANYVNDTNVNGKYGYLHPQAQGLRALESETFYHYWLSTSGTLNQYGVKYFLFRGNDTLQIDFTNLPDQAMMIKKENNMTSIIPINQQEILPKFNMDDEFIMVLTNSLSDRQYVFSAFAPFSFQYYKEIAYDDYQTDGVIAHNGSWSVANKFIVPSAGVYLSKIKYYNGQSNTSIHVQIYNNNGSGKPGSIISSSIDTTISYPNTWAEIKLSTPITGLSAGQSIFVGVEFLDPNKTVGYDQNNVGEGISFIRTGNAWLPLSAASSSEAGGVLMIRAIFEGGLIESGKVIIQNPIALLAPNPNFGTLYLNTQLNGPGDVVVQLFNVLGQKVGEYKQSFSFGGVLPPVQLNTDGVLGQRLPSGVYFSNITFRNTITGEKVNLGSQKIILLK